MCQNFDSPSLRLGLDHSRIEINDKNESGKNNPFQHFIPEYALLEKRLLRRFSKVEWLLITFIFIDESPNERNFVEKNFQVFCSLTHLNFPF